MGNIKQVAICNVVKVSGGVIDNVVMNRSLPGQPPDGDDGGPQDVRSGAEQGVGEVRGLGHHQ